MFVNSDYLNYKYLVEVSDNYIVLSNQSSIHGDWQNPDTYNVIYQYLKPSTLTIEETRTTTNTKTFKKIDVTDNYWSRADCCEISDTTILIFALILFYINMLTRLFKKGGMFFGS